MTFFATVSASEEIEPSILIAASICFFAAAALALGSLVLLLFFRRKSGWGLGTALGAILVVQFPLLLSVYLYRIEGTAGTDTPILPCTILIGSALLAAAWQRQRSKSAS